MLETLDDAEAGQTVVRTAVSWTLLSGSVSCSPAGLYQTSHLTRVREEHHYSVMFDQAGLQAAVFINCSLGLERCFKYSGVPKIKPLNHCSWRTTGTPVPWRGKKLSPNSLSRPVFFSLYNDNDTIMYLKVLSLKKNPEKTSWLTITLDIQNKLTYDASKKCSQPLPVTHSDSGEQINPAAALRGQIRTFTRSDESKYHQCSSEEISYAVLWPAAHSQHPVTVSGRLFVSSNGLHVLSDGVECDVTLRHCF